MWISRRVYQLLVDELQGARTEIVEERARYEVVIGKMAEELKGLREQLLEQLIAARVANAGAHTRAQVAEQQRAVTQANFEWVAAHSNELAQRNGELTAKLLTINPVSMQIDASRLRDTVPVTIPTTGDGMAGTPLPDEELLPELARRDLSIFDDMGDELAERQGLKHGPAGEVVRTR